LSLRIYYETGETAQLPKIRFGRKSFLVLNRPNQSVIEFFDFLQSAAFGIGAENGQSSENPELTQDSRICSEQFLETLSNKPAANHLTDFDKAMKLCCYEDMML